MKLLHNSAIFGLKATAEFQIYIEKIIIILNSRLFLKFKRTFSLNAGKI